MEKKKKVSGESLAGKHKKETQKYYQQQIRELIRQAEGSPGYLTIESVSWLHGEVNQFLQLAQQKYEEGDFLFASELSCTILEEMTTAMEYTDDSKGDLARIIDQSLNLFTDIASEDLPEELRKCLFEYFITSFRKSVFFGWHWHFRMLDLALFLMKDEKESKKILAQLDKEKYADNDEALQIRLQVLRMTKGEKAADLYLEKNIAHPTFRTELIEKAIRDGEYTKAVKLANDGIRQDEKEKPGRVFKWYDLLLKTASAEKNLKKVIEYARFLFIASPEGQQRYYQIIKDHIENSKWSDYLEKLITDIRNENRWSDFNLIAEIYIREKWWDRLFDHVSGTPQLNYLEHYEKYLSEYDKPRLIGLYKEAILKYVESEPERKTYQEACYFIERIIQLRAVKEAKLLIRTLEKTYPGRKALLEELEKIKY